MIIMTINLDGVNIKRAEIAMYKASALFVNST